MAQVTIAMYHFVRELPYTRYPKINGLLVSEFKEQLSYMEKHYTFVTMNDCIEAIKNNSHNTLPKNAIMLTFDDAYIDHYTTVFPILNDRKIQGSFFPPAKAITNYEVLDVNKIHFILAVARLDDLLSDLNSLLDKYRSEYTLESYEYYFTNLANSSRFDSKEIIFIKRLLQVELDEKIRTIIINDLFKKYITIDEQAFSRELYMNVDHLKCMIRNGMYVGSHGYDHYWLNSLPPEKQEKEIDLSLDFLGQIEAPTDNWVMCYPYGAYNDNLIQILKRKNCALALTTKVGIAQLSDQNAYTLERFDANDFKKNGTMRNK